MAKRRVLLTSIFPLFLPFFVGRFFPLAKHLADEYDFTFLVRGPLPDKSRWLNDCNIVEVPPNVKIVDFLSWKELFQKTIALSKEHDILFPQKPFSVTGGFCFLLSKVMKKGFVQDADDYERVAVKWYFFQEKLSEFFLRKAAKYVSVASTELLKRYWQQGVYIPNCPDLEILDPYRYNRNEVREKVRRRLGISQDEPFFIWSSYFSGQEDNSYMPLVFGELRQKGLKFRLVLMGGGPQGKSIISGSPLTKDIIDAGEKAGIPQEYITVTGRLPFYEYREILTVGDAAIIPLRNHPFDICKSPGKLLIPMALEVPIIATNIGEAAYIVPRAGCGILIPPDNPQKAAEKIIKFVSLPQKERAQMGTAGRRYLELHHDAKTVAKRLANLFAQSLIRK